MIVRSVIRHPTILTTPRELAHALGVLTRNARPGKEARWGKDFFMHYPSPNVVRGDVTSYLNLYTFFAANKRDQRRALARQGLPVPREVASGEDGEETVIRPLRHSGGHGWQVQEAPRYDRNTHYGSVLFPKTHEYRLIYVLGKPIIFLKKVPVEGRNLQANEPWNHGNTTFVTLPDAEWPRSNLNAHTDAFRRLGECDVLRAAHYVGVDVLYNRRSHEWVVCEFNVCPALTIPENRAKVADFIKNA